MRELRQRAEPILKIVCLILAAVVVYQLAGIFIRLNPFRSVVVPQVPSLTASTNAPAGAGHGTNLMASGANKGTNQNAAKTNVMLTGSGANTNLNQKMSAGTNALVRVETEIGKTNSDTNVVAKLELKAAGTNFAPAMNATNEVASFLTATNSVVTNQVVRVESENSKTNLDTNAIGKLDIKTAGTNAALVMNSTNKGTNLLSAKNSAGTNAAARPKSEMKVAGAMPGPDMGGMNFNPFGGPPGKRGADLPPAMQTRISRIVDSEILGPVMHPLPMALLGIAGDCAFLRSPSGQTGLVKEGDSLGELKLLRIGINRVLVEQNGKKEELTIFSGYGGDSLLPKQKDTPDENEHP